MTTKGSEETAIDTLFDNAFSKAGQRDVHRSAPPVLHEHLMTADFVSSHQLEFTVETADFLTRVVDHPRESFGLVYNFLNAHLASPHQPLGRLALQFSTLFQKLFVPAPRAEGRPHLAPRSASSTRASVLRAAAASSMHLGVRRLHQIVVSVLPPLQDAPASQAAMEAV